MLTDAMNGANAWQMTTKQRDPAPASIEWKRSKPASDGSGSHRGLEELLP
jgi:hypothetical protein